MGSLAMALLLPSVADCGTSLTITFNGSGLSPTEIEDDQGVEESSALLRLIQHYAAGHVQVKNSKLPSPGGDEITSVTVRAGGVTLDANSDRMQAVSIRAEVDGRMLVATLRAYKPERTGSIKVEAVLRDVSADPIIEDIGDATGVNLADLNDLVLSIEGTVAKFSVGPTSAEIELATLSGITPGELGLLRLELLDTSEDKTLPSVASLKAELGIAP